MLAAALSLSGCSYSYEVIAIVIGGKIAFIVSPNSSSRPSCVREVEVLADRENRANAGPGDDKGRVGYGTFWRDQVGHHCTNSFPVFYGVALKGEALQLDQSTGSVSAKPLRVGVTYEVNTVSGAAGYGSGAFKITSDRKVINLQVREEFR